jgi:hypothetical protein
MMPGIALVLYMITKKLIKSMEENMKQLLLGCLLFIFASSIFALGSFTDSELVSLDTVLPELQLISPNGGEIWYIGDTRDIIWTATDPNLIYDSINLDYSLNGGVDYINLAEAIANSGNFAWELPSAQSYSSRVRVGASDSFGNHTEQSSAQNFAITYVPPAEPIGVNVDTSDNQNALISWDAVTQTIPPYNSPITPDGYIVLYNETPYEDDRLYYFLGRSFTTSYTHLDVVEFRDQMFYRIKAYKNYSREESAALESLVQRQDEQALLWQDALDIIRQGGTK